MELAASYLFCPVCGSKRTSFDPVRPFHCSACQHTSFFGPVAAVGAVVTNSTGQVLLLRRAKDPQKGKLGMPGGFIDQGETAEEALRREVFEEVGLQIDQIRYLMTAPNGYVYRGVEIPVLDMFFHAVVIDPTIVEVQPSEVEEWLWTDLSPEILDEMAFESNRKAMRYYQSMLQS